jgi:hypothetical protein
MAPVGNVFPNRVSASLPPDSLAPMMPDPMTVANRNADPKNSEPTRLPGEKYTHIAYAFSRVRMARAFLITVPHSSGLPRQQSSVR